MDRYHLDVKREWDVLVVGMLPIIMVEMVSQTLGVPWDHSTGLVVGNLGYPKGENFEKRGCAVVECNKGGEVRYWDPQEDMPATLDKAPMTSKANSNFVVIGVPPGVVRQAATINRQVVTTKDTRSFAGEMTSIEVPVATETNPTPANCAY